MKKRYYIFFLLIILTQSCRYKNLMPCEDVDCTFSNKKTIDLVKVKIDAIYHDVKDKSVKIKKVESAFCSIDTAYNVNILRRDGVLDIYCFDLNLNIRSISHQLPPLY